MIDEPCDLELPSAFSIRTKADPSSPVRGHLSYHGDQLASIPSPACHSVEVTERTDVRV